MADLETVKKQLQKDIGKKPKVEIDDFVNWATTRRVRNILVVKPTSLEEVQAVVKAAAKNGLRIRCAGATHSWSPLFADEGQIVMHIRDIQRHDGAQMELLENPDGSHKINVMAGVTVEELLEFELKNDVNLSCNVVLRETTYSGMLATGCHGVGWDCAALSDYCTQMRIVDSSGELRTFRKDDDLDMMLAIQCNLGLFGIMYDMQLEVLEKKIAHVQDDFSLTAGDLFYDAKRLKELVTSTDSVEILHVPFNSVGFIDAAEQLTRILGTNQTLTRDEWDPRNDKLWVKKVSFYEPSDVKDKELSSDAYYNMLDIRTWVEGHGQDIADEFIKRFPQEITPLACKAAYNYIKESSIGERWQPLANAIHYRPNADTTTVQACEVAINVKDDFSDLTKACQVILELMRQEAEQAKFPVNLLLEMRWMKYSEAYLCPAMAGNPKMGGSGHTVCLEILSYTHTPGWKEFANKFAREMMKIPGTLFHWGKEWEYVDGIESYIQKSMKKQIGQFRAALDRSKCDPKGMFLNDKLQQILFPDRTDASEGNNNNSQVTNDQQQQQESEQKKAPRAAKSSFCHVL